MNSFERGKTMIAKRQIIELFHYDEWANFKLLDRIHHLEKGGPCEMFR